MRLFVMQLHLNILPAEYLSEYKLSFKIRAQNSTLNKKLGNKSWILMGFFFSSGTLMACSH